MGGGWGSGSGSEVSQLGDAVSREIFCGKRDRGPRF